MNKDVYIIDRCSIF